MGAGSSHHASKRAYRAQSLGGGLPQSQTNGKSRLGTLLAPLLPMFLTNNPLPNGYPWSLMTTDTNYYIDHPKTGVIRTYDFTISRGVIAPDGYQRDVLFVNGAFPGPLIEANCGDTIQVTVHNNITGPEEGTALHWHGFLQTDKGYEDGVPAVTQCPIAPGKSFTYSFEAELYGSTWYHSHYSAQYAGGLFGPIVVYGPSLEQYDEDIGPVMLSDWYHRDYYTLVEDTMSPEVGGFFFSDNNLINGKMNFDCSKLPPEDKSPCVNNAGISKFRFESGKIYRLRLMNVGSEGHQRFSIDGHKMKVIANDFVMVEPYETEVVSLGIGQRTDVLVEANGDQDAYWMRSTIPTSCALASQPNAFAAIYYDDADDTKEPESEPVNDPDAGSCANDDLSVTKPLLSLPVIEPDKVFEFEVKKFKNESGVTLWSLDGVDYRGNYNSPTMLLGALGNHTFEKQWNVRSTGDAKSVRVILHNRSGITHPMHLHGFNMYVLHLGEGDWDGTIIRGINPQRRDVVMVLANGHMVMQFDAGHNPGVWPFHCHIAWHVSAGFFIQFMTNPDKLKEMRIPSVVAETCRQWGKWTETNIPDQIDSGL